MSDTLSIHEFSKLSGIGSSTLRYWDDLGIFSPIMRHPNNNYRHYSKAQLTALNFVTTLSELGIPRKNIAELSLHRNPEDILSLFEDCAHSLDAEMASLMVRYSILHTRVESLRLGLMAKENEISVIKLPRQSTVLWPSNKHEQDECNAEPLSHLPEFGKHTINQCFPIAGYHCNLDSFIKRPGHPDNFMSVDPFGTHKRIAGKYLVGYFRGNYGKLGDLPERMLCYAKSNSINISGPTYTYYLHDEISTSNPNNYLAQCCIFVGT